MFCYTTYITNWRRGKTLTTEMETLLAELVHTLKNVQVQQERLTSHVMDRSDQPQIDTRGIYLQPYDELNESFEIYLQRLQNYLALRNLSDDTSENNVKSVQILLNCLGPKTYQTLVSLTAPDLPSTKKYQDLIDLLRSHLCPKPSEIAEQYKFLTRIQHEGESIAQFQAELKKLTVNCNFTCENCKKPTVNTYLRGQFIRGVHCNETREKLLQFSTSKTLSFEEAVSIASAIEASKAESKAIQNPQNIHTVSQDNFNQNGRGKKNTFKFKSNIANIKCFKCGKNNHKASDCHAKNLKCNFCKKNGHLEIVCFKKRVQNTKNTNLVETDVEYENIFTINSVNYNKNASDKIMITMEVENTPCQFEVDTGAAVSTCSVSLFNKICPNLQLQPTTTRLRTYTGEIITPLGECNVKLNYENQHVSGRLFILAKDVSPIFGREWLRLIKIDWSQINSIDTPDENYKEMLENLLNEYNDLFTEDVGLIKNYKCSLKLQKNAKPTFIRARPVPYALKDQVEEEIDRLEKADIIEKVTYSEWGTPVVPIVKKNGNIRLCADYKVTLNKFLLDDNYPIPRIEDIFANMSGGKYFCTLDINQAYLHMPVDDSSSLLQTISTSKGSYRVKRLMFGVKVAPNAWQRFMDQTLHDITGVGCFFDDIMVQGSSPMELIDRLKAVFDRLRESGLHVNKGKSQFFKTSVSYLGHTIDKNGLHPLEEKIEAIKKSPKPTNVSELRSFLGIVNYYHQFLPNLASKLHPLHQLLQKNTKFIWNRKCEIAFNKLKEEITSKNVLTPFNVNLPVTLATDASPVGLGAVLSNIMEDGTERPVAFASRSLSKAEKNYSQLDKEATALIWGLRKFFQYCYGREITIIVDNKPLSRIFHPEKNLPVTSALRLIHYANFLAGFNYKIKTRTTQEHSNADYLSRCVIPDQTVPDEYDVDGEFYLNQLNLLPVSRSEILRETQKDPECWKLFQAVQSGKGNINNLHEYSLQDGCIFYGIRVVIPKSLQGRILQELHEAHTGMVKMKAIARSYVWWHGIDKDIETTVKSCRNCCLIQNNPKKVVTHFWEKPKEAWHRIHIDYAGPLLGTNFLIIVDAYTKWFEAIPTSSTTSKATINILRDIFSRFGLPVCVVSDNGRQFKSHEILEFFKSNGITCKFTAPYHPATNGQAERYVQILKQKLRAMMDDPQPLNVKLARLLMQHRKCPSSTTGLSPAELMFKRPLRTRIDLVKDDFCKDASENVTTKKSTQCTKEFKIGDRVQVRWYDGTKWKFGNICGRKGVLHYEITVDGQKIRRHVDQLRSTNFTESSCASTATGYYVPTTVTNQNQSTSGMKNSFDNVEKQMVTPINSPHHENIQISVPNDDPKNNETQTRTIPENMVPVVRRSERIKQKVRRMDL